MPRLGDQLDNIALLRSTKSWAAVHELARTWVQIGRNPISGLAKIAPHIGIGRVARTGSRQEAPRFPHSSRSMRRADPTRVTSRRNTRPFTSVPMAAVWATRRHGDGQAAFDRRFALLQNIDAENRTGASEIGPSLDEIASFNFSARKLMYNTDVDKVFTFDRHQREFVRQHRIRECMHHRP